MNTHPRRLLRTFVTGLLAALPLLATVAVVWWMVSFVFGWLGPESGIGSVLVAVGFGVTGSVFIGYLFGVGMVVLGIFGLGVLVTNGFQRGLSTVVNAALQRIPLVGSIYDLARRLVGMFSDRKDGGMNSMSAVWCHFGGPPDDRDPDAGSTNDPITPPQAAGVVVLALLSTREPVMIDGRPYLAVIIPTAPVPIGGGLLYVPQHWVRPASIGIEAVTSIYVSMGITSNEQLRREAVAPPS
jgi:uncharacterized membrane protein